jgi:hypothetical protein
MNEQNQAPMTNIPTGAPTPPPVAPHEEKSIGSAIGIIIIIVIILLGGLYFWGQRTASLAPVPAPQETKQTAAQPTAPADVNQLNTQSSSDSLNSIQADVNATNLNGLGSEVGAVNGAAAAGAVQPQ